jgi:hypothetical protein
MMSPPTNNKVIELTDLIKDLYDKSEKFFQIYKTISARCPRCGGQLAIKYASNPKHLRKLSVIIACTNNCDRKIWNTDVKSGFTHWWLDSSRDRDGYLRIIESLPLEEKKMIGQLERGLQKVNR